MNSIPLHKAASYKLSVIIPVYNELLTLYELVERVRAVDVPKEIIIVDDFSTDGTRNLYPELETLVDKIVLLEKNSGKGAAIREGLRHMTGDYVIIQDADLEYDPQEYHKLLQPLLEDHADVVYGSRFFGGQPHRVLYFWHSIANRMLTLISNMFTNLNLTDMETCYKVFKASVIKQVAIQEDRFGFEPEITGKLARMHVRIYEVGISYHGRSYEEGKKIGLKDAFRALWCILKYSRGRYHDIGRETLRRLEHFDEYSGWIFQRLDSQIGDRVLEVGSGVGSISSKLTNKSLLILSDINDEYLDILRKRYARLPNIRILPFDIRQFQPEIAQIQPDTILCVNVLEHVADDVRVLSNLFRILAPGGRLILLVPSGKMLFSAIDQSVGHFQRYDKSDLIKKLEQCGFSVEKAFHFNRLGWFGWFIAGRILRADRIYLYHIRLHKAIMPICRLVDKLVPAPFGLSLVAVSKKL